MHVKKILKIITDILMFADFIFFDEPRGCAQSFGTWNLRFRDFQVSEIRLDKICCLHCPEA